VSRESVAVLESDRAAPEYAERQSRTLRILACVYLDMGGEDCTARAMEAADRAIEVGW
jgi:hypothetical protein